MKKYAPLQLLSLFTCLLGVPCGAIAQSWEAGVSGGYSFSRNLNVSNGSASGSMGLAPGFAVGGLLGNDTFRYVGGEVRYTFLQDDLRVSSSGAKVSFGAQSHAVHYDVLVHAASKEASVRPFLAAGAGADFFRGTGAQSGYQPLSNLVLLSHTTQVKPLVSVGGGVKIRLSARSLFRLDFRDYLTPFPDKLLALPSNSHGSGWLNHFILMAGISATF